MVKIRRPPSGSFGVCTTWLAFRCSLPSSPHSHTYARKQRARVHTHTHTLSLSLSPSPRTHIRWRTSGFSNLTLKAARHSVVNLTVYYYCSGFSFRAWIEVQQSCKLCRSRSVGLLPGVNILPHHDGYTNGLQTTQVTGQEGEKQLTERLETGRKIIMII